MNRPVEVDPNTTGNPEERLVARCSGWASTPSTSSFVKSCSAICRTLPCGSSSRSQMATSSTSCRRRCYSQRLHSRSRRSRAVSSAAVCRGQTCSNPRSCATSANWTPPVSTGSSGRVTQVTSARLTDKSTRLGRQAANWRRPTHAIKEWHKAMRIKCRLLNPTPPIAMLLEAGRLMSSPYS